MVTDFRKVKAEPLASCPVSYPFPVKHQFIHNAHVQIAIKKKKKRKLLAWLLVKLIALLMGHGHAHENTHKDYSSM